MADRAERYAKWIVANKDKKGTPEFETVAKAYRAALNEQSTPEAPKLAPRAQSTTPIDRAQGALEAGATVVSGLASSVAGGLAGVASLPIVGPEQAAANVRSIQEAGTYQPRSKMGAEYVQNTVEALNTPLAGYAGLAELAAGNGLDSAVNTIEQAQEVGVGKVAGNKVLDSTGSPLLATAAELTPDIAGILLGAKGINAIRRGDDITPNLNRAAETVSNKVDEAIPDIRGTAKKQEIAERIHAGDTSGDLAEYRVKEPQVWERLNEKQKPQAEKDPKAIAAIKQGFDKGVIRSVKNAIDSSPANRFKMKQMVELKRKGIDNQEFASVNRPSNVAGKSLGDMVREVERKRVYAGSELDKVAKSLRREQLDTDQAVASFMRSLTDDGIEFIRSEDGRIDIDFRKSGIQGEANAERLVRRVIERMANTEVSSAYDAHRLKQYIYNQINYAKGPSRGLNGGIETKMKGLANSLDTLLDDRFPTYARVNEQYASARSAIDVIEGLSDSKLDINSSHKDNNYGTLLRRTMSNAQSKDRLMDALAQVQEVANSKNFDVLDPSNPGKFKGKTFNDNLIAQALFVDELDRMFRPAGRTSFQGQIDQAMTRNAVDTATGRRSVWDSVADAAVGGVEKARGINEENALKSIRDLLNEK